jgi:glutamine amidotransferase
MSKPKIGVFQFPFSNSASVYYSFVRQDFDCIMLQDKSGLSQISHLIFPGVGSYFQAMKFLQGQDLIQPFIDFQKSGKSILGICLGMQILSEVGNEGGIHAGFGFIQGSVRRLESIQNFRVPHVGWNSIWLRKSHPIFEGISNKNDFYFSHSYQFETSKECIIADVLCDESQFVGAVAKENVVGVQFHPEKSHKLGLRLLKNFASWNT